MVTCWGELKCCVHEVRLRPQRQEELSALASLSAEVTVSIFGPEREGSGPVVRITTPAFLSPMPTFYWDEEFFVKCGQDWRMSLTLTVMGQDGSTIVVVESPVALPITSKSNGRKTVPLHQNDGNLGTDSENVWGTLDLSIDFARNEQSFMNLSILARNGCEEEGSVCGQSVTNSWTGASGAVSVSDLEYVVDRILSEITLMLSQPATVTKCSIAIEQKAALLVAVSRFKETIHSNTASNESLSALAHRLLCEVSGAPLLPYAAPTEQVPAYSAVAIAHSMYADYYFPEGVEVSTELLEKQLSLFLNTCSDSVGESSVSRRDDEESIDPTVQMVVWTDLVHFLLVIGVWLAQQSVLACTLLADMPDLSGRELFIIRSLFSRYDTYLDGHMSVCDLVYLLQDMGGAYTDEELSVIQEMLDPDNLLVVDFLDFMHWWVMPGTYFGADEAEKGLEQAVLHDLYGWGQGQPGESKWHGEAKQIDEDEGASESDFDEVVHSPSRTDDSGSVRPHSVSAVSTSKYLFSSANLTL